MRGCIMNTPTTPRRPRPLTPRPRAKVSPPPLPAQICTYVGIHAKTGKRYSVRVTSIGGEVSPVRLTQVIDSMIVESSDPTLP
jgi:hypothetical protein